MSPSPTHSIFICTSLHLIEKAELVSVSLRLLDKSTAQFRRRTHVDAELGDGLRVKCNTLAAELIQSLFPEDFSRSEDGRTK
mmetsp:Transcript_75380/g.151563  ORF Transcript_75380/g.151563 Transcript_75380/m.151563 type:complete len:82 (-) Transcript_75380:129-374(-)